MTAPDGLTPPLAAAWSAGAARALHDLTDLAVPTTVSVTLDQGGGHRTHIDWCLHHQLPARRCPCGAPVGHEDVDDVLTDVATVIAETRDGLTRFADAAEAVR